MTSANSNIAPKNRTRRVLILLGAIACLATAIACSDKSKNNVKNTEPITPTVKSVSLETIAPASRPLPIPASQVIPVVKQSKPIVFKSRDYGVSFQYPWQYQYLNAKKVATGDASLLPKDDGYEGQFTLARVDVPKGFYPDTNYDSGYFTLSLNQDLSAEECSSSLKSEQVKTETLNGMDFKWAETEVGGHGSAEKIRNYVAYANDTCYEFELGVKTKNDEGLARELDPDQVMKKLNSIMATVEITPEQVKGTETESSKVTEPAIEE